jgi:DNA-binding CsgD family transcriptional regulator
MGDSNQVDQLIDTLYATAVSVVDACAWCGFLPRFCSAFDAAAGGLIAHDFVSGTARLCHSYNIGHPVNGASNGEPWGQDLPLAALSGYHEGAVFGGEDIAAGDDLHRLCGMITRADGKGYLVDLVRSAQGNPFGGGDKEILARLLPHLKRSLQIHDEVAHGRSERESLLDFMDQLPVAILLVSRGGRVHLRNHRAQHLLAQRDGICLRQGYLAGSTARITFELRELVANAANSPCGSDEAAPGEHFVIARGPDRLPLISVAYPGRAVGANGDGAAESMVVVVIKDPEADSTHSIADFIKAYDITHAEARLIGILGEGHGLFEAARQLGITKNTARTHMRNIYAKVGTHRQSDLVRLLYRFHIF